MTIEVITEDYANARSASDNEDCPLFHAIKRTLNGIRPRVFCNTVTIGSKQYLITGEWSNVPWDINKQSLSINPIVEWLEDVDAKIWQAKNGQEIPTITLTLIEQS